MLRPACRSCLTRRLSEKTVDVANWARYFYLAYLSQPGSCRPVYRLAKSRGVRRIVEIGVSDVDRTSALIRISQWCAANESVFYTAVDWFDARREGLSPLSLKHAYRVLRGTGAKVRLVPGAPGAGVATAANAHPNIDLLLIGADIEDSELECAWFYVPRMLHKNSIILRECRDSLGRLRLVSMTPDQVAEKARFYSHRRAS